MCSWQVAVPPIGPCATPLIIMPHEPQMPSRQSCSNAIGSSPFSIRRSLTTSSISRNDTSGLMSVGLVRRRSCPSAVARLLAPDVQCRGSLLVAPRGQLHVLEHAAAPCAAPARCLRPCTPRPRRRGIRRRRACASPSGVWFSTRKWPPHDSSRCSASRHISSAELEEVGHAAGLLQRLVQLLAAAEHAHVAPELLAQLADLSRAPSSAPRRCGPCRSSPT